MKSRADIIKELRGATIGSTSSSSSSDEVFQNEVLRPILKLQNDLFVAAFKNYITKYQKDFYKQSAEKKSFQIENAVQKDVKFRNSLKGMVVGLFTLEEYQLYTQNSSSLNKRMMSMLVERLKSQIQLFDTP